MFERYTEKARRAIFFARYEASQNGSTYIESIHLLLGILRDNSFMFSKAGLLGTTAELAESCRRSLPASREKVSVSVDLPLSNECRDALTNALAEADQLGSESITPQHLLLGLIKASSEVSGILNDHGVTAQKLCEIPSPTQESSGVVMASGQARATSAFVQFLCQGERFGSAAVLFANPLPRVGDEVVFHRENEPQTYKVLAVKYHFEEPPQSKTPGHAWLAKIVIETERIDSPGSSDMPVN